MTMVQIGFLRRRRVRRAIILLIGLFLSVPIAQVLWVRWINPHTTAPAFLKKLNGDNVPPRIKWLEWKTVPVELREAMLIGEGVAFFEEGAFDWIGIRNSIACAWRNGERVRGASTITQQCARSLFLWQGRSWIRKIAESYYAFWMNALLSKQRILELYSNVIELGDGVYGIEGGAEYHFNLPASQLSRIQIASLIAVMPNPRNWHPKNLTGKSRNRAQMILNQLNQIHGSPPSEIPQVEKNE